MNSNFSFIESGIIFETRLPEDLQQQKFTENDFSLHGAAYTFLLNWYDNYKTFPSHNVLVERFPTLDVNAVGAGLGYCINEFCQQIIYRHAVEVINNHSGLIKEKPEQAVTELLSGLSGLLSKTVDDAYVYDSGKVDRYDAYLKRKEMRNKSGFKIIGIPTPLRSINRTGVGMTPGEVHSIFARPAVGKSWYCVKAAAIGLNFGCKTIFISSEMTSAQIALRLDVVLGNILGYSFSHHALRTGNDIDDERYKEFLRRIKAQSLPICTHVDNESITLRHLTTLVRKYNPSLIVIDGAELLNVQSNSQIWERMNQLFYGIKHLCVAYNIIAVVSTQANRGAENIFRPPRANNVANGDGLLRASDVALSMCRVENEDKKIQIHCQKFRDSPNPFTYVTCDFDVDVGLIRECT